MPTPPTNNREFTSLVKVVEDLMGPDGCPWDKEQTPQSLTPYLIEETYELVEAIESGKVSSIKEEIGDLLFHAVIQAEVADNFDINDCIFEINNKLIRRHPHVFSDLKVSGMDEIKENWEKIKAKERASEKSDKKESFNLTPAIPSLINSQKIGDIAYAKKFDWDNISDVIKKVDEELQELKEEINCDNKEAAKRELGDLLFSVAQLARHLNIDAETSLRNTNKRFEKRFFGMMDICADENLNWDMLPDSQKEILWARVKAKS